MGPGAGRQARVLTRATAGARAIAMTEVATGKTKQHRTYTASIIESLAADAALVGVIPL